MGTNLPPRKNLSTLSRTSKEQTPLSILLQMGFSKHRAEKAIAATGNRDVQLAADWLLAHVNDPTIDDCEPREYILYVCPSGEFMKQLEEFWTKSKNVCWNGAHNYVPHITLVSFFKAPDDCAPQLSKALKDVVDLAGSHLDQHMSLELYISHNFIGFFVTDDDANYLKRLALQYVKEVSGSIISDTYEQLDALVTCFPWCGGVTSNTQCIPRSSRSISLEPHVKSLHLTLAYQFPSIHFDTLKSLAEELNPFCSSNWELRLYSRDSKISSKQVRSVLHTHNSREPDELELRVGDYIFMNNDALQTSTDGWIEGSSWLTGATGYFPDSYTKRTAESDAWTIHQIVPLSKCLNSLASNPNVDTVDGAVDIGDTMITEQLAYLHDAGKSALYDLSKSNSSVAISNDGNVKNRQIYIARHGERVDFTFGRWIPHCFDETGNYMRKDLNMPKFLPNRANSPDTWLLDSPITNIGMCQAKLTGDAMKDAGVNISYAYCSPSYRCVQTCHGILEGLGLTHIKIRIEFALFEWMKWYQDHIPEWCTKDELYADNFNIDMDYESLMTKEDLRNVTKENSEQFYMRNHSVVENFINTHASGNALMVGHACTLDSCTRLLLGRSVRTQEELTRLLQKVSYCSMVVIEESPSDNRWQLKEPCCFPVTHNKNARFEWKVLDN